MGEAKALSSKATIRKGEALRNTARAGRSIEAQENVKQRHRKASWCGDWQRHCLAKLCNGAVRPRAARVKPGEVVQWHGNAKQGQSKVMFSKGIA